MWDTAIVTLILVFVGIIALRSVLKTFKGEGGCGGGCACSEKPGTGCPGPGPKGQELTIQRKQQGTNR